MKKLMIICLFFTLTACAQKLASPEEVNRYLDGTCHIAANYGYEAALEGKGKFEMQKAFYDTLKSL
jgi:hypothetical protein